MDFHEVTGDITTQNFCPIRKHSSKPFK